MPYCRPGRSDLKDLIALRSGEVRSLESELGELPPLIMALRKALAAGDPVRLRLTDSLTDYEHPHLDWARIPFEWLREDGCSLHGRLLVERCVARNSQPPKWPSTSDIVLLTALAGGDAEAFGNYFNDDSLTEGEGSCPTTIERLNARDHDSLQSLLRSREVWAAVPEGSALVVVCHGSELDEDYPFAALGSGSAWALPECEYPPLVVLLVCGNDNGNLLRYANEHLLRRGAVAVLASVGKLDLQAAAQLLPRLLSAWAAGCPLHDIVLQEQKDDSDGVGARRLCLLGNGDLAIRAPDEVDKATDEALVSQAGDDIAQKRGGHALMALANRITLRCLFQQGTVSAAAAQLRKMLGVSPNSRFGAEWIAALNDAHRNRGSPWGAGLWPLTARWLQREFDPEAFRSQRGEFTEWLELLEHFPLLGESGREAPGIDPDRLPMPIALRWARLNAAMDRSDPTLSAYALRECVDTIVRFGAAVAAIDLLKNPQAGADELKRDVLGTLLAPIAPPQQQDWFNLCRKSLFEPLTGSIVPELRAVFFDGREWTTSMRELAPKEFFGLNDIQAPEVLAMQVLRWWPALSTLLRSLQDALGGWHLVDQRSEVVWHGVPDKSTLDDESHRCITEPVSLALTHFDGRTLELAPLLAVQVCASCARCMVFFFDRSQLVHRDFAGSYVDGNSHAKDKVVWSVLSEFANGLSGKAPRGKPPEFEAEEALFREFGGHFEEPRYLIDAFEAAAAALPRKTGYIHLTGSEGTGKTWYARHLADTVNAQSSSGVLENCALLLHVGLLSNQRSLMLVKTLAEQVRTLGLHGHDLESYDSARGAADPRSQFVSFVSNVLQRNRLTRLLVILDGLDELLKPLPGEPVVLDLLPISEQLPAGCVVLLTSRPQTPPWLRSALARLRETGCKDLQLNPSGDDNIAVVRAYVEKRVQRRQLAAEILRKSGGVFLWAFHLVQGVQGNNLLGSDVLPEGGQFYQAYLTALKIKVGTEIFETLCLKTLLLLAAAREPVSAIQLIAWGVDSQRVRAGLLMWRDFIREHRVVGWHDSLADVPDRPRYAIFHQAFVRFLESDVAYASLLQQTHADIARTAARDCGGHWDRLDATDDMGLYALQHWDEHARRGGASPDDAEADIAGLAATSLRVALQAQLRQKLVICVALCGRAIELILRVDRSGGSHFAALRIRGHNLRAFALSQMQRPYESLEDASRALELMEKLPNATEREYAVLKGTALLRKAVALNALARGRDRHLILSAALEILQPESDPEIAIVRARVLNSMAIALSDRHERQEALAHYDQAVQLYRQLVTQAGDLSVRASLAMVLENRGSQLRGVDRLPEAASDLREAMAIRTALVDSGAQEYVPGLASSHGEMGLLLLHQGRVTDALHAFEKSVLLRSSQIAAGRDEVQNAYCMSVLNRASCIRELGRRGEALEQIEDVIGARTALASRGFYVPQSLANALHDKATTLYELGRPSMALDAVNEAIEIRQSLLAEGKKHVEDTLATAYILKGTILHTLDMPKEAYSLLREAIPILELIVAQGSRYRLSNLVTAYLCRASILKIDEPQSATDDYLRSVEILRSRVDAGAHRSAPRLFEAGRQFLAHLVRLGAWDDAAVLVGTLAAGLAQLQSNLADSDTEPLNRCDTALTAWRDAVFELDTTSRDSILAVLGSDLESMATLSNLSRS